MRTIITRSSQETQEIAFDLAQKLLKTGGVVALSGELGAGKTTFAQGFAKGLGITEKIISPTFILIKQYPIPNFIKNFYHLDLYRLDQDQEFEQIGLTDLFNQDQPIILIEWAEKAKASLPTDTIWINLKKITETTRQITIKI